LHRRKQVTQGQILFRLYLRYITGLSHGHPSHCGLVSNEKRKEERKKKIGDDKNGYLTCVLQG
jgi:hypothetical protein